MTTDVYKSYLGLLYAIGSVSLLKILSDKQLKTWHLRIKSKAVCTP
jgi:hypothetical protein